MRLYPHGLNVGGYLQFLGENSQVADAQGNYPELHFSKRKKNLGLMKKVMTEVVHQKVKVGNFRPQINIFSPNKTYGRSLLYLTCPLISTPSKQKTRSWIH